MSGQLFNLDTPLKKGIMLFGLSAAALASYFYLRRSNSHLNPLQTSQKSSRTRQVHSLSVQEAMQRSSVISNTTYTLKLVLNPSTEFKGSCKVIFELSDSKTPLFLDFNTESIESFTVNGENLTPNWEGGKLHLPQNNLQEGVNEVEILYTGSCVRNGLGLHYFKDPEDGQVYLYTQFEPFEAHKVFPCFDQPDIKARLTLSAGAPGAWRVLANSPLFRQSPGSEHSQDPIFSGLPSDYQVHQFEITPVISTYLYAICAGPYYEVRLDENETGIPLGLYCRDSLKQYLVPERYFNWTIKGLDYYIQYFKLPFPFKKYDQIFVPEHKFGAMENVGLITYNEAHMWKNGANSVQLCGSVNTFLHEMAHMWFGNLVTMKWWDDLWLNESFATYMSHYVVSQTLLDEFPEVWNYFMARKGWGYATDSYRTTHPIQTRVGNTEETETNFDGISYSKGSSVLKQLSFVLGSEVFRQGVVKYILANKWGNTEYQDLIDSLKKEAELAQLDIDVEQWSQQWVKEAGFNFLQPEFTVDPSGNISEFIIHQGVQRQEQPTLRTHQILLEFFDSECKSLGKFSIKVDPEAVTHVYSLYNKPAPAAVFLNIDDQDFVKIRMDPQTQQLVQSSIYKFEESLTRQLIWRSSWDSVKDGVMSCLDYLDMVSREITRETSHQVLGFMLNTASVSLGYAPDDLKQDIAHNLFMSITNRIASSGNKDEQNLLRDYVYAFVRHPNDLQRVFSWLQADRTDVQNLELRQVDRWSILKKYCARNTNVESLLQSEKERDKSSSGALALIYCQAAIPDPRNKEETWQKICTSQNMSRYERNQLMNGMMISFQKELLSKYTIDYFNKLVKFANEDDHEFAIDFCKFAFPEAGNKRYLIDTTEGVAEEITREKYQIYRWLVEKADDLIIAERAIGRARARLQGN